MLHFLRLRGAQQEAKDMKWSIHTVFLAVKHSKLKFTLKGIIPLYCWKLERMLTVWENRDVTHLLA
jgi:hypothetical protein